MPVVSARPAADAAAARRPAWQTYAVLIVVTLVSVFPLYYTVVMASHTNAEMAAATPPLLPNTSTSSTTCSRRSSWPRSTRA